MLRLDFRINHAHTAFGIFNEAESGVRLHTESQINQLVSSKTLAYSGRVSFHKEQANSLAKYPQNRFLLSKDFTVIPGALKAIIRLALM